jgi:hypothetical protein
MATVTVRYGGDTVTAGETAVHVSSTELPANTLTGYDPDVYPASPEVTYYFSAEKAGVDSLRSQVFAPDDGHGEWHGVIFPSSGSWAVHVRATADDSSIANEGVTVA